MPDLIDAAQDADARNREACIREVSFTHRKMSPAGECYNCGTHLSAVTLFCDADCRDDFEKRQRIGRIGGVQ